MGAVVHADHGDRGGAGAVTLQQQGTHQAHGVGAAGGAVREVGLHGGKEPPRQVSQGIALFRNGKAHHLKGWGAENSPQLLQILRISPPGAKSLRDGGHYLPLHGTVGLQADHQGHRVVGGINLVHDVKVKGIGGNDAALDQPLLQQRLLQPGNEAAKNVAGAKVDPGGMLLRLGTHGLPVKGWQPDSGLLPGAPVLNAGVAQFHIRASLTLRTSGQSPPRGH